MGSLNVESHLSVFSTLLSPLRYLRWLMPLSNSYPDRLSLYNISSCSPNWSDSRRYWSGEYLQTAADITYAISNISTKCQIVKYLLELVNTDDISHSHTGFRFIGLWFKRTIPRRLLSVHTYTHRYTWFRSSTASRSAVKLKINSPYSVSIFYIENKVATTCTDLRIIITDAPFGKIAKSRLYRYLVE